ncbi:MAG: CCA tRNA nucleotidyltransferase [Lachnospiraceae bacterium]|nr:CCA tRNA nucleotidyltransferase [Lachnospiraceae bacterium]
MKIVIPVGAQKVLEQLQKNGFEAYVVGGCVRDSIMGRCPNDWDITTSALPEEVKTCFERTIDTGIVHGTVTVRMDGESYEVTTYRIDGKYEDGRHPTEVTFTPNLEEDLKRRDFTINAMAYNPTEGLVDLFGGVSDIERKMIRCVGDGMARFSEDALRMLRALRFSAQLDFDIEEETFLAIQKLAPTLEKISAERIQVELVKLVTSNHPEKMRDVYESGLSKIFMPEWDAMMECPQNSIHHCYNVGEHTIEVMKHVPAEKKIRLAALLHDVGKPLCRKTDEKGRDHFSGHPLLGADMAKDILQRLKFDNATIDFVVRLVRYHDERPAATKRNMRRMMNRVGSENIEDLLTIKRGDAAGQSEYQIEEKNNYILELERLYKEVLKDEEAVTVKDLKINGKDLMDLGIKKGPKIGEILHTLLELVIEDPSMNDREILLDRAKKENQK